MKNVTGKNLAQAGFWAGLILFAVMLITPAPAGMAIAAWRVSALALLMAIWWMTQALPLTVTALLPFAILPLMGVMDAKTVAEKYYSDTMFLILGGAFLALAIERSGLHRRVALAILMRAGTQASGLLCAFMAATALLSMVISNTSTTLIMIPIALAVLSAGGVKHGDTGGIAGALVMGIAFSASIGGMGTIIGSPTNAIAAGLINGQLGIEITFLSWLKFGLPVVAITIPIAAFLLIRVQRLDGSDFRAADARAAIGDPGPWNANEMRLMPVIAIVMLLWVIHPWLNKFLASGGLSDGTIAILGALLLFVIPDGTGRPLLIWKEADRAPWGVIMMFGGGLALAAGISASGLATWLGAALLPLASVHPLVIGVAVVALVILITEFANNVATATGVIPVVAGLAAATGADPWFLAMAASIAASWGFMLPSGTAPNVIGWATGHIALPKMLKAGFMLDLAGIPIIIGVCWAITQLT